MNTILVSVHIIAALFLVLIVLLQTGKGTAMGSAFGGAGSQAMFGSTGAGNILSKLTTLAAVVFMCTSLALATLSSRKESTSIIPEQVQEKSLPGSSEPTPQSAE